MDNIRNGEGFIREVEESFSTKKEQDRVLAILDCYGVDAHISKKEITIEETGEIIKAWHTKGILNVEDLKKTFPLEIIVSLYDSEKDGYM